MSTLTPTRRSVRTPKLSLRAKESEFVSKLKTSGFIRTASDESFTDEEEYLELLKNIEKPTVLHEDENVHGKDIFKFQSRKHKDGLAQKVSEACSQKTPFAVRRKTKNKIVKLIEADGDSDSDYKISTEENSSSEDDTAATSSESEDEKHRPKEVQVSTIDLQPTILRNKNKYVINTEEYFENASSNKIKTSNNTLDKLETPRLPQYQLQKLLQDMKISKKHEKCLQQLSKSNQSYFNKWLYLLNENFNILLYGLGSKKNILNKFHTECLQDMPVIVINGFFPTLTLKSILDAITVDLLDSDECPTNLNEACDFIIQEFESMPDTHLYLIIHNIEGEMIRNNKTQNILSKLACIKNIHLIASIDHINGPLIWDHNKLSKFNYTWWDVTSFLPYTEETSYERSMMIQQTGALALSSLKNIFLSLTANSKNIYTIIAKYQLQHGKSQYYQGIAFKDLYLACRENFVVSSDLALRAQLTEFIDHKMVKIKRSVDGSEYLMIPLQNSLLQKFIDENS